MGKINREGTINNIEFLVEEGKALHSKNDKLSLEITKMKMDKVRLYSIALYEMYHAIYRCEGTEYSREYITKLCHYATAMVCLCYKLNYIDNITYHRLTEYLDLRIKHC